MVPLSLSRACGAAALIASLAATIALPAQAALPSVSLRYDMQSGIVGPSDTIEVWITLTVDPTGAPLVFDAGAGAPFGFAAADLPTSGFHNDGATYGYDPVDFASYNFVQTNTSFGCSGTFTSSCTSGPPYDFSFHTSSTPGQPSFNFQSVLALQPGQSTRYLFGSFTPTGGVPVPDGTYVFYNTSALLLFSGLDADGHDVYSYVTLGDSCSPQAADCAFTRTVVSVPEPATWTLLASGVWFVAFAMRRRRRADAG